MAEKADAKPETKVSTGSGAESPTTAKELDFEDDVPTPLEPSAPESAPQRVPTPKKVSFQEESPEVPPTKPPRPISPQAQAETTLIEAFPSIDAKVVKAVLVASGGKVEPAFNALLSMTDPDFQGDAPPPPQPPRPTQQQRQMEQDERYARQLAAHYQDRGRSYQERGAYDQEEPPLPPRPGQPRTRSQGMGDDKEHSFFDDDLPVIRENMRQGFLQTQKTVNKWLTDFKKKLDGDEEEDDDLRNHDGNGYQRQDFGPSRSDQLYGIRKSSEGRRSGERERYDADPRVLGDDFEQLELRDDEAAPPQQARSNRPLANPDLFKPNLNAPQSGPVDEVDALYRGSEGQPNRQPSPANNSKSGKKWQPLTSVAPNPEADDNDPFSLGDSDEEERKTDVKAEDTERLKQQAADKPKVDRTESLSEAERSGSINKEADELLKKA